MEDYTQCGLVLETDPAIIRMFSQPVEISRDDLPAVLEPPVKCTWGLGRIKRFISGYIRVYRNRHFPNREQFLAQQEEFARENGVKLPTPEEMHDYRHKSADKLVSGLVDANDTRVSTYKYYKLGSQYVAYVPGENAQTERSVYEKTHWDELFDFHYRELRARYKCEPGFTFEALRCKIESELVTLFYEGYDYNDETEQETCYEFISRKIYNTTAAYCARKRRFHRKKDQTQWTAWWTITYDDSKFSSEASFRKTLLKRFNNLAVRKDWRIMGVFEHGEENKRLHFHGFFFIPEGQEVGELVEQQHYSKKHGCIHKYIENTDFRETLGVNEYEDIREATRSNINAMAEYTAKMCRYMEKGEKVFYSRHLPSEFVGEFFANDMVMFFNISCKRKIKRYVIDPSVMARSSTVIKRRMSVDEQTLCDIGLIDDPPPWNSIAA